MSTEATRRRREAEWEQELQKEQTARAEHRREYAFVVQALEAVGIDPEMLVAFIRSAP